MQRIHSHISPPLFLSDLSQHDCCVCSLFGIHLTRLDGSTCIYIAYATLCTYHHIETNDTAEPTEQRVLADHGNEPGPVKPPSAAWETRVIIACGNPLQQPAHLRAQTFFPR